uniref:hypothetical protein n=1 Tax=Dichomitus squalens TaxID=114155 RepID=UPI00300356DD|nr:hypothetical protein [Dichomitus squalens]
MLSQNDINVIAVGVTLGFLGVSAICFAIYCAYYHSTDTDIELVNIRQFNSYTDSEFGIFQYLDNLDVLNQLILFNISSSVTILLILFRFLTLYQIRLRKFKIFGVDVKSVYYLIYLSYLGLFILIANILINIYIVYINYL